MEIHSLMKYLVSHDIMDTVPIPLKTILRIAFDACTNDDYADYLLFVLEQAKSRTASVGQTIEEIEFYIHENGCIHPFGLGGHEYCMHFYTLVDDDLHF